eukprot:UN32641
MKRKEGEIANGGGSKFSVHKAGPRETGRIGGWRPANYGVDLKVKKSDNDFLQSYVGTSDYSKRVVRTKKKKSLTLRSTQSSKRLVPSPSTKAAVRPSRLIGQKRSSVKSRSVSSSSFVGEPSIAPRSSPKSTRSILRKKRMTTEQYEELKSQNAKLFQEVDKLKTQMAKMEKIIQKLLNNQDGDNVAREEKKPAVDPDPEEEHKSDEENGGVENLINVEEILKMTQMPTLESNV